MPRTTKVFKKRKLVGKENHGSAVHTLSDNLNDSESVCNSTSSSKKIAMNEYEIHSDKYSGYELVDLSQLSEAFAYIANCKYCGGNIAFNVNRRIGLAAELKISCTVCCKSVEFFNSEENNVSSKLFDINLRLVYAMRSIGKGHTGAQLFCGIMNLPPPPTKFSPYVKVLGSAAESVCSNEMQKAVSEAVQLNDGSRDLSAAFDGTWQKRGHVSQNGVVTCTSVDTGKVLDHSVLSKYCRCRGKYKNEHDNACTANYSGISGGMEVQGVSDIFHRSSSLFGVRYLQYLGDGDSKAFKSVNASKPYGDGIDIQKLECIGHVQKRMGSRLRDFKMKRRNTKLSDGKAIGGKNRLTDALILKIQKYYGLAIRRNVGSLMDMRKAVWAEYFHLLSTNDDPQHGLCPPGDTSWCKARKLGEEYDHCKHTHIPKVIMEEIKPIFNDLSVPQLLKKCLHGKTQNPNESLNNVIWTRLPKTTFVSLRTLRFGVHDAISCFNSGNATKCRTLEALDITPGIHCITSMKALDLVRVCDSERKLSEVAKKAKQKRNIAKNKQESIYERSEGVDNPSYGAGLY